MDISGGFQQKMKIQNLCKSYDVSGHRLEVLKGLTVDIDDKGITVILGRSGCGKTTLLRLIAGLEKADSGTIGNTGKMGIIFQEPRLMPWLSVTDNILFGLGAVERKQKTDNKKLKYLLELTGLNGFEDAYPAQLSGGMQQRAALARALAYEPEYLLMDEPFAALDYFTRKQMQEELLKIYQAEKRGVLFVTHSIDEALAIGTKILILEGGGCKKEYDMTDFTYPRDLLSMEMVDRKKCIISYLQEAK